MTMPRLVPALSSILSTAALAAILAACGCASRPAEPAEPTGGGTGGPTGDDVATFDITKFGTACGETDRCEGGTSCTRYYGIAGPSGPEFKSCEVACSNGKGCPAGATCITIADGPGSVCRASDPVEEQPVP